MANSDRVFGPDGDRGSTAETVTETPIAIDRSDLIKRLFAVCLSVGFAAQIANMSWLLEGRLPLSSEVPNLLLLVISLILIVLSWDGYLAAISTFPLVDMHRFFLDVAIVFVYLILLQLAHTSTDLAWVYVIDLIFILYTIWDCLTIRMLRDEKVKTKYNGLVFTIPWLIYFLLLTTFMDLTSWFHFFVTIVFILYGVVVYRVDIKRCFSWLRRGGAVLLPIVVLFILMKST
jgi:hypothetical protein